MLNKKHIIFPAFFAVLMTAWLILVFLPMRREASELKGRLDLMNEKVDSEIPYHLIASLELVVDSLVQELDSKLTRIYPEERLLDLGRVVEQIAGRFQLKLVSIAPIYESLSILSTGEEKITELPMTLEFKGGFSGFTAFLDHLPDLPYAFRVEEVILEKEDQSKPELLIELQGVIVLRKERNHEENPVAGLIIDRT